MSIKLIATDVDGTLFNSNNEVSPATMAALQAAADRGIQIVISTGRLLSEFTELAAQLSMMRYTVTCTGAQVLDLQTNQDIFRCALTEQDLRHLYGKLSALDAFIQVFSDHDHKIHDDARYVAQAERFCSPGLSHLIRTHHVTEDNLDQFVADYHGLSNKLHIFFADLAEKQRALDLLQGDPYAIMESMPKDLEIMALGVDKAVGLSHLAAYLGLDRSEIMALGDGGNDAAMLRYAGLGVAMKNASQEAKDAADWVLDYTNDEDGVARAVEAVLNGEVALL